MFRHLLAPVLFSAFILAASPSVAEPLDLPAWLLRTKFEGDFRYRHESTTQDELTDTTVVSYDRHRHRIRFRVGMITSPSERVTVGFRLASGSGNPRSTNQDLTSGLSGKDINLDHAYMDYHPCEHGKLVAGKSKLPFVTTSQLVWDGDISPEGISLTRSFKLLSMDAKLIAAGLWTQEYAMTDDQGLLAAQGVLSRKTDELEWQAAVAYYDYQNAQSHPVFSASAGNTLRQPGSYYEHDYDLLNFSGKATLPVLTRMRFSLYFDAVENTALGVDRHGTLGGVALACKEGSLPFSVDYSYRDLDADATLAAFTESDFAEGLTDVSGHSLTLTCSPLPELQLGAIAMLAVKQKSTRDLDFRSLLLDAVVKF